MGLKGTDWSLLSEWHQYRCARPDSGMRALESGRPTLDVAIERRFHLLDAVNRAGRYDLLRVAGHSWELLEKLAAPLLRKNRARR